MFVKKIISAISCMFCRKGKATKCCKPSNSCENKTQGVTMSEDKKTPKKKKSEKKDVESADVSAPKVVAPKRKKP